MVKQGSGTAPSDDTVVARHPDVAWQKVDGELVLLDCRGHRLLGLNATAARAWELFNGQRTLGDIARAIAAEFAVGEEQAATDLWSFTRILVERQLAQLQG
jgi:hypothetical protein